MEKEQKIMIDILPNIFVDKDGVFNSESAINLGGKIAGVCYSKEGFKKLKDEDINKTKRRVDLTLNNGHHSVYDHITINFNIHNIPKILAMVINNEHQYTTSEKSLRYTPVVSNDNISKKEEELYYKWLEIFKEKIAKQYKEIYSDLKIKKLAQENARYLVSVFMPTEMIYTTSLRQINYIVSWMKDYISNIDKNNNFEVKLASFMQDFINELDNKNILVDGLLNNDKKRGISLFANDLDKTDEYFNNIYYTKYEASFAYLAQAQRHRTINYKMEIKENKKYYIPEIIKDDSFLTSEWIKDINSVKDVNPQGELINIFEFGTYENFILKCKERLCSASQLEIMLKTREILLKYKKELKENNSLLYSDIEKYTHGARCTFPDFVCREHCNFKEGITLTRKI